MTALITKEPQQMIEFTEEQVNLIKRTIAKDATDDELALFFHQAKKAGLDPLAREIYFVKYKGTVSIQTGIDGYYKIAHRSNAFLGNKTEYMYDQNNKVISATCTVKKLIKNGAVGEFSATCLMNEYNKRFNLWQSIPTRMLEKCAEAAALRKAFPNELSGLYTAEEMPEPDKVPATNLSSLPASSVGDTLPPKNITPKQTPSEKTVVQVFDVNNQEHHVKFIAWCEKNGITNPTHIEEIMSRMDKRPLTDTRSVVTEFENELKAVASEP